MQPRYRCGAAALPSRPVVNRRHSCGDAAGRMRRRGGRAVGCGRPAGQCHASASGVASPERPVPSPARGTGGGRAAGVRAGCRHRTLRRLAQALTPCLSRPREREHPAPVRRLRTEVPPPRCPGLTDPRPARDKPSPLPVRWQSGDAADCKSANVGSIPARTFLVSIPEALRSLALARFVRLAGLRGRGQGRLGLPSVGDLPSDANEDARVRTRPYADPASWTWRCCIARRIRANSSRPR